MFRLQVVAFLSGDEPKIEQRRNIVWISAQALLQVTCRFVVLSKVPIAKTHEHIRARGRIQGDERLELLKRFVYLANREVALSQSRMKIGSFRINSQSIVQHFDRVLKERLLHTQLGHEEKNVRVVRRSLSRPHQQFQRVHFPVHARRGLC